MRIIFVFLILPLITLQSTAKDPTLLTYEIQHQIQQADNFVEMSLTVQTESNKLGSAIQSLQKIISNIEAIALSYCEIAAKNKQEKISCKSIVQAAKYSIEPKYHLVRKISTFHLFIVTQEVKIEVRNAGRIGKLTDEILAAGQGAVILQGFTWKAHQELNPQSESIKEGVREGKELCQKFGKKISKIVEVEQFQSQSKESEERDEDLAAEDVELSIFKFKVQCG